VSAIDALTAEQVATLTAQVSEVFSSLPTLGAFVRIRTKGDAIVDFGGDRWHEEQRRFEAERSGWDLVLKPRQIGFSTLELLRDLSYALTHPGTQTLVVVHDRKLGELLFSGLKLMHDSLESWGLAPSTNLDNLRELSYTHLASSVRVVEAGATSKAAKNKGRSGTVHRLHATEVAFWPNAEETMTALLGALSDDGEVVIESTPNGAVGMFYQLVQEAIAGRGRYRFHFYPWFQHRSYRVRSLPPNFNPAPRDRWEEKLRAAGCDDHQIEWWRTKVNDPGIGLDSALQEWPLDPHSAFRSAGGQWLPPDAIDALTSFVRPPLVTLSVRGYQLRIYRGQLPYQLGGGWGRASFIIGGDVAEGIEGDRSALTVLDDRTGEVVASLHSSVIEPGDFGLVLADVGRMFSGPDGAPAMVAPERNNNGHATLRALTHEANYPEERIYQHEDERLGWPTNLATRPVLFDSLGQGIRQMDGNGRPVLWTPDADTAAECKTLIRDVDGRPRASGKGSKGGAHDDLFVSWAIAHQVRTRPAFRARGLKVKGL
jgi:hypothetical protein